MFRVMNVNGELFGRIATNQPVECVASPSDAVSAVSTGSVVSQINLNYENRGTDRRRTLSMYLINKYISLFNICLTVHH